MNSTSHSGRATRVRATARIAAAAAAAGVVTALVGASAGSAQTQAPGTPVYSGSALFRTYCAVCHGLGARGDGPLADRLKTRPPDLTQFAKQNGGKFPSELVYKIIDGRQPLSGHGGKDMPIWGEAFKATHDGSTEESVKARITALVEFLESIQERTGHE